MKKLAIVTLLLIPVICFSQKNEFVDDIYAWDPVPKKLKTKTFLSTDVVRNFDNTSISDNDLQLEFMRYCNFKYHKQRITAYSMFGGGLAVGAAGVVLSTKDNAELSGVLTIAGGVLNLAALVALIDADKWLKYSSIKPARDGLGISITF